VEDQQESQPQVITLERPKHHHVLLTTADGRMLGLSAEGALALFDEASDDVIWDRTAGGVKHVVTGMDIAIDSTNDTCTLSVGADEVDITISHGPEKLPSETRSFRRKLSQVWNVSPAQVLTNTWSKTRTLLRSVRTQPLA
jgi:hypothetical protein